MKITDTIIKKIKRKKFFLLDMDGTIYLDNQLFSGSREFLNYVRNAGGRYIFLTNNSSKGIDSYIEKMEHLGINANIEDFLTSVDALIDFLRTKYGAEAYQRKIYLFGTESFKKQMRQSGFNITDKLEDGIDILVLGFDRELTFSKLEDACILLGRGVEYFATNPDWVCPTSFGYVPDCGSMAWMIEKATGKKPVFIGKPQPEMVLTALKKYGYSKEESLLIGDRLYTDIACGNRAGVDTAFVLSGEGTLDDLKKSEDRPTYVFKDIEEIYDLIRRQ